MRLEEADEGRKQCRFTRPGPKLVCPDPGQVDEPVGPALVTKRCRKCGERESEWIMWTWALHDLETAETKETNWRGY